MEVKVKIWFLVFTLTLFCFYLKAYGEENSNNHFADNYTDNLVHLTENLTEQLPSESDPSQSLSLLTYKPIYFLVGGKYAKIQFSFATQVTKNLPIYFGYTQLMMWDILTSSPYFYDLNYNPIFWYRLVTNSKHDEWIDLIPWEHESNGKGGAEERAWDRAGVRFHRVDHINNVKIQEFYKLWVPFNLNKNNLNIMEYRGYLEANLTFLEVVSIFDFTDLIFRIYSGGSSGIDPTHGGQELTLRTRAKDHKFLPFMTFQIFHGYGEYLQDYTSSLWGVRIGVGF